ncbi:helix-turn-helix domain-containing protein [Klebsiella pneumoniae]|nr:helix-turn-helix domain-containing protein [Klebsiella pneumoniae subsp. ozaenae]HDH0770440.1 helix-turn-helix domain-containing protein [Klebsiella pneumoniae]
MSECVTQNDTTRMDWHRADIIAALHKCGWSVRQLAFSHGYKSGAVLKSALDRPWPKGEKIIADALGIPPDEIWPERYRQRRLKKFAPGFLPKRANDWE